MATNAHEPTARAPATVDARTAPRIAAAVVAAIGDAEADGGFPDDCTPGSMNSAARSAAAGSTAVLLAGCLAAGWWLETQFGGIAAHARPAGGSLKEPALGTGPRAARDGATGISSRGPGMNIPSIVTAAAAATMTASASVAQSAVEWPMSAGGNGHWYGIRQQPLPWDIASERARNEGGHLVTLAGSAEWDFLWAALGPIHGSTSPVWIGGYQDVTASDYSEPSGGWRWVTGEPWSYTSWASGCPNDNTVIGNEDAICTGSTGGWNDLAKAAMCASLIEWSVDCNADGIVDYGQIRAGTLPDANGNGIPDGCECTSNPSLPVCCTGDIVSDGRIDGADLGTLLAYWGPRTAAAFSIASDLDGSGHVDGADLAALLSNWGTCQRGTVPPWATVLETQPDPAVVTDAALRAAIAATGMPWRVRDTATGIEMLLVPPGTFQMGCVMGSDQWECSERELPVHPVTLTNAFYMGRFEVTQAQWLARMGWNPSFFRGHPDSEGRPVEQVSWLDIQGYLNATGMRLPTEAEWEFACRAGTSTPFYDGTTNDHALGAIAWNIENSDGQTHAVGGKVANGLGLYDLLGNVWEWVNDWFGPYPSHEQTNPMGPAIAEYRVIRGGSWAFGANYVRSSYRWTPTPGTSHSNIGFRVARDP